jgi:hypothetical protein
MSKPARQYIRPTRSVLLIVATTLSLFLATNAGAVSSKSTRHTFLGSLENVKTLGSTTPANGDENPYSIVVAPVSAGSIHKGDVLVDNFNAKSNEQGTGSTIVDYSSSTGRTKLFASIPKTLAGCPGGVGLSTAMTMLKTGWIIVGSAPSSKGTIATSGAGCLIVIDSSGKVVNTIAGPKIDGPWDMATKDQGARATLYVTNTLFGVKAAAPKEVYRGTLLRISLKIEGAMAPQVTGETVVASGLPEQASPSAFVLGPTGVAIIGTTAYVAEPLANAIIAVANATTRTLSAGAGTTITSGGDLHHPIAMIASPDSDLLVTNGLNGDVVEVSTTGKQLKEFVIDPDPAQSPPGSGDLFGLAVAPNHKSLYFLKDDTNTLAELS